MQETLWNEIPSHRTEERILITGFLVPTKDGKWCLAETPAGKSCCLGEGAISLSLPDLLWEGSPPRHPIRLLGIVDETAEGLVLHHVEIAPSPYSQMGWGSTILFGFILIGFFLRRSFCKKI